MKDTLSLKKIYSELNSTTKHLFKITVTIYLCLIFAAVFSHISNIYELLLLQNDFLSTARSIIATGGLGVVLFEYIDKK